MNVTYRRAPMATFALEEQSECWFVALVFSIHRECAILYCRLEPACVYRILPYYLMKGKDFPKEVTELKIFLCSL